MSNSNSQNIKYSISILLQNLFAKILFHIGIIKDRWCLAIVNQDFKIQKIFYPPKNFFWADPFFFLFKKKKYVFFESYSYSKKRGEIACGELKNNKIKNIKIILKKKYHLSYPFIFKFKNKIFLIPETYENKRLEVYESIKFPFEWKIYSTGFNNIGLVDSTILKFNKNLWLFTNQMQSKINDFNKFLYIYKIDGPKLKKIIPHKQNPVIRNLNGGRSAGSFIIKNKKIIRPSQVNQVDKYGYALKFSTVDKITISNFKERKIKTIIPEKKWMSGIHHVSKINHKQYLVDICLKYSLNK